MKISKEIREKVWDMYKDNYKIKPFVDRIDINAIKPLNNKVFKYKGIKVANSCHTGYMSIFVDGEEIWDIKSDEQCMYKIASALIFLYGELYSHQMSENKCNKKQKLFDKVRNRW